MQFIEPIKSLNVKGVSDVLDRLFESNDDLDFIAENAKRSWAYWATVRGRGIITLHAAPLFPKTVLAKGSVRQSASHTRECNNFHERNLFLLCRALRC